MELIADTKIHANPMGTIYGGVLWRLSEPDTRSGMWMRLHLSAKGIPIRYENNLRQRFVNVQRGDWLGLVQRNEDEIFPKRSARIWARNGVNSVALAHRRKVIGCKLLK